MTLRELVVARILCCVDDDTLMREFHLSEADLNQQSDLDLFDLYENILLETYGA